MARSTNRVFGNTQFRSKTARNTICIHSRGSNMKKQASYLFYSFQIRCKFSYCLFILHHAKQIPSHEGFKWSGTKSLFHFVCHFHRHQVISGKLHFQQIPFFCYY